MKTTKRITEHYRGFRIYSFGAEWFGLEFGAIIERSATKRGLLKQLDTRKINALAALGI